MQELESNYRERLCKSIRKTDIDELTFLTQGKEDSTSKSVLYKLMFDKEFDSTLVYTCTKLPI